MPFTAVLGDSIMRGPRLRPGWFQVVREKRCNLKEYVEAARNQIAPKRIRMKR